MAAESSAASVRDPLVRKDGRCARKGCTRLRPIVALKGKQLAELKRYAGNQAERDPFCSATCCRSHHGCPLDNGAFSEEQIEARSAAGRRGKLAGNLSNRGLFEEAA